MISFDAVKLLIDLILRLAGVSEKRRRDVFEQMLVPIFDSFLDVHTAYIELFDGFRDSIPYPDLIVPDSAYIRSNGSRSSFTIGDDTYNKIIEHAKESFLSARDKNEWARDRLRNEAGVILDSIKYREERRFLLSIIYYFLEENTPVGEDEFEMLDIKIGYIIRDGGITALNTPSMRLAISIESTSDLEKLRDLIRESRNNLNQRFSEAARLYKLAQFAVINKSST